MEPLDFESNGGWGELKQMTGQITNVLVAEDEWLIRTDVVDMLRESGFEVVEAEHADEAIKHLQVNADNVHVLVTDIHMPRGSMDGIALAHHVRQCWPSISIIISSSHPEPHKLSMPAGTRFLPKPLMGDHLARHVRELTLR